MSSKEQQRSEFALRQLERFTSNGRRMSEDMANFIVGVPTMILQNGFGQTMAFLLAKCKGNHDFNDKHYFTFKAIARWSERQNSNIPQDEIAFFNAVAGLSQQEYLTLQEEALKMLQWLKRYARAFQEV
jgi:CRISPR-associated protein Cmr5